MKQVTVISGKGGTGKTSLVASMAHLGQPMVTADCDVDAANLALLLPGLDGAHEPFYSGRRVTVDLRRCEGCGTCEATCRFDAIHLTTGTPPRAHTDPFVCEGCGACTLVCPVNALEYYDNLVGTWTVRKAATGPLVHAMLGVAQDNSGLLVTRVRDQATQVAQSAGLDLVLLDGPPGIGSPVQESVRGVDLVLAVSEPTSSGEHDLVRVLDLAKRMGVPAAVVINKTDLAPDISLRIDAMAQDADVPVLGRLPFDPEVPRALARGALPMGVPGLAPEVARIWGRVRQVLVGG